MHHSAGRDHCRRLLTPGVSDHYGDLSCPLRPQSNSTARRNDAWRCSTTPRRSPGTSRGRAGTTGISRNCFDKWLRRYQEEGIDGLRDRSSRPHHSLNATHTDIVNKIAYLRQHYHFGPLKIQMCLQRYHDIEIASSAIYRILKRLGMNRLPASQRYQRRAKRYQRYEKQLPRSRVHLDVKCIEPIGRPTGADPDRTKVPVTWPAPTMRRRAKYYYRHPVPGLRPGAPAVPRRGNAGWCPNGYGRVARRRRCRRPRAAGWWRGYAAGCGRTGRGRPVVADVGVVGEFVDGLGRRPGATDGRRGG
ncbi:helix-turn-helix domain-containing protein [Actinomadura sp. LD22]|uniref:Helix-turn-helix domain-containing protein n=1 Tax=Actinomadura physcomitrii TaxID=2650748 RepID=A0A6I4MLZ3_9ACTN|nr:helix-turn-helix domain-containing protein [Actinomadura physcomitrii]